MTWNLRPQLLSMVTDNLVYILKFDIEIGFKNFTHLQCEVYSNNDSNKKTYNPEIDFRVK